MTESTASYMELALRKADVCAACGIALPAGTRAAWLAATRTVICLTCISRQPASTRPEAGTAGASARAIYEQQSSKREVGIRAAHPRLGGMIVALTEEPQHIRAWKSGAEGEERIASRLAKLASSDVSFLHDRKMPRSKANIDHLAIAPRGIFVIDAKRYVNQQVEVRRQGGILSARTEHLFIGGRDKTALLDGLERQIAAVREAIALACGGVNAVPVTGILCFIDAQLPMIGSVCVSGVPCIGPKATARQLNADGPIGAAQRESLLRHLAAAFPPAH